MSLIEGTPEYEAAKKKADKRVDTLKWLTKHLLGSQFEKTPDNTQITIACAMDSGYVKYHLGKWLEEFGFKVWLNRGFLGDIVIDWSHNKNLPETTIKPLYEDLKKSWRDIAKAVNEQ